MKIAGLQKLTLLDYPGYTACTVFTGGCNFKCPFCHNSQLIVGGTEQYSTVDIINFLKSRRGKLDGICITGGEPLLQNGLEDFLHEIHDQGFLIKLDTNGSFFERLQNIIEQGLCDYVAMDIKNIPEKYQLSAGGGVDIESVKKSVQLLINSNIAYEFRTTVVKELNTKDDFKYIAEWLAGANGYFLQKYKYSEQVPNAYFTAYSDDEMREICEMLHGYGLKTATLRGID